MGEQAERIAAEGESVRERVKRLVLSVADGEGLRLEAVRSAAGEIMDGVSRGVHKIAEDRRGTVLAETIDGLSDGFARAAQATKLAIEEAEGRGARFTKEDLGRAATDLRTLEKMFEETVVGVSKRLAEDVKGQVGISRSTFLARRSRCVHRSSRRSRRRRATRVRSRAMRHQPASRRPAARSARCSARPPGAGRGGRDRLWEEARVAAAFDVRVCGEPIRSERGARAIRLASAMRVDLTESCRLCSTL